MRSSTDASLPPWPMRILRPWLVASAAGLLIGTLLLSVSPAPESAESYSYTESAPRAAVYGPAIPSIPDPFAPSASLAAPPDGPSSSGVGPASIESSIELVETDGP